MSLPEPRYGSLVIGTDEDGNELTDDCFATNQMLEYGQQCRDAALLEERNACEERVTQLFERMDTPYLPDIAKAIHGQNTEPKDTK